MYNRKYHSLLNYFFFSFNVATGVVDSIEAGETE